MGMIGNNNTTVVKGGIGGGLAFILVLVVTRLGVTLGPAEVAGSVSAFTAIFQWIIPQKLWFNREPEDV